MLQILLIVAVMFLWAICFPLIALRLDYSLHLTVAAMRGILAGIVLLIPVLITHVAEITLRVFRRYR